MAKTKPTSDTPQRTRRPTRFIVQSKGEGPKVWVDPDPAEVEYKSTADAEKSMLTRGPGVYRVVQITSPNRTVRKVTQESFQFDDGAPEPAAPEEKAPDA